MTKIYDSKEIVSQTSQIGGKAKGLLFLSQHHFNTPTFYVLNYETLIAVKKGEANLNTLVNNWINEKRIKLESLWAVRSSADNEDGTDKSFAGFFTSVTNVQLHELPDAIWTVLKSYSQLDNQNYTEQKKAEYGIIIQEMIRSEYSGVVFSHNPFNIKDESIHINLIPGLGENLVSGKEEAFEIIHSKNKFHYSNIENTFFGQIYEGQLNAIQKEGQLLKNETAKYLDELILGTKKLGQLKKIPIDIEFTIAQGVVYWLQVRPITTGKNDNVIWDNTSAESNYSGITMPLSISMATNSFYRAYKSMARFLGMPNSILNKNDVLLRNMSGEINGRLYYNVTAWQKLIFQLPFGKRASKALPGIWGMKSAEFTPENNNELFLVKLKLLFKLVISFFFFKKLKRDYNLVFKKIHTKYEKTNLNEKSHAELVEIYTHVEEQLGGNWEAPMLNGFFTILFFSALKKILKNSRLNAKYPNFINDILFSQRDVISVVIINEFQSLISEINNNISLKELFKKEDVKEIMTQLATAHKEFFNAINNYIYNYGDRSEEGELKMETINYKEDPSLFFLFLKSCANQEINSKREKNNFNYKEVVRKEYRFHVIKRIILSLLIKQTIKRVRDRENFRFMRTSTFGLVRRIFRAIDNQLLKQKLILEKGDSMYLLMSEIRNLDLRNQYINTIDSRKEAYKKYSTEKVYNRYIQNGEIIKPDFSMDVSPTDSVIKGVGCSSGIVKAEIKLIEDNASAEGCSGKILVANFFEPGKLNLFAQSAGLISIRGNLLSHTSILCREMGIPAIVSAKGLLQRVKDGDIIEMDGATGIIKLISKHE